MAALAVRAAPAATSAAAATTLPHAPARILLDW